jgi:hypothetical protein
MARTTSIDVSRTDLIKRLKEVLKSIPQAEKDYDKAREKFNAEVTAWAIGLMADPKNFKDKDVSLGYRGDVVTFELTKKAMSTKPKMAMEEPRLRGYAAREATDTIQNTLNILELSKAEFVGVSIVNKISQYL